MTSSAIGAATAESVRRVGRQGDFVLDPTDIGISQSIRRIERKSFVRDGVIPEIQHLLLLPPEAVREARHGSSAPRHAAEEQRQEHENAHTARQRLPAAQRSEAHGPLERNTAKQTNLARGTSRLQLPAAKRSTARRRGAVPRA